MYANNAPVLVKYANPKQTSEQKTALTAETGTIDSTTNRSQPEKTIGKTTKISKRSELFEFSADIRRKLFDKKCHKTTLNKKVSENKP